MSSKWGWGKRLAVVIGLLMVTGLVSAQQQAGRRGGGMMGRGGLVILVVSEPVQKELKVEGEMKEKLRTIASDYAEEAREQVQAIGIGGFQNASDEDREKLLTKMQEVTQSLNAKYLPKIKEVLTPEQFTRLQQISWQASGASAFADPELAKTLNLSQEQQDRINAINQDYRQKQRALFTGGRGNAQEAFAKIREITRERDQKAEGVLSPEQQDKFKQLKGNPFDLAQLRQGGSRRENN